ncbi:hypothetical protein CW304_05190 [Bacillus sp. UFRGS-B20]|nr:hypothetical protein CW304_05190 [Bacillus sp. UFRGS-B20]
MYTIFEHEHFEQLKEEHSFFVLLISESLHNTLFLNYSSLSTVAAYHCSRLLIVLANIWTQNVLRYGLLIR